MSGTPGVGRRKRLLLVIGVVLLVGLAGCLDSAGIEDTDDVLYPNGGADASASPAASDSTGSAGGTDGGTDLDVLAAQTSPDGTTTPTSTPTESPPDTTTTPAPETEDDAAAGGGDGGDGGDGSAGGGGGGGGADSSPTDDTTPTTTPTPTAGSTFVIDATSDAELTYEFTVDGDAEKTRAEDGTAADADDQVTENDDGTTTVVGSTGGNAGDAYLVDGEITSFERTGGEGGYELYLDGEDVTDVLSSGGADGGNSSDGNDSDGGAGDGGAGDGTGGDDGNASDGEETFEDSTYDILHTRSIQSNGDGTTTISGEVWNQFDGSVDDLVMVVEVYDDDGEWLASEWVELDPVTTERQSWSVTFDVPREEIGDFRADVNRISRLDADGHNDAPGQCVEIQGDGPNDEEAEPVGHDVVTYDGGTVVVGEVMNGADEHDMAFVRVFVSIYDDSGNRLATETTLMEDVPQGEFASYAVSFDETDVADARVDADEMAIRDGELACRPPL